MPDSSASSDRGPSDRRLWIALNLLFAGSVGFWIFLIPFDHAPDEFTHFHYNVEFILKNHRLPVCGVDDLTAFKTGRINPYTAVTSRMSYAADPALNYLIAAAGAWLGNAIFSWEHYRGARLASLAWGLLFLNTLLLMLRGIGISPGRALLVTAAIVFIPQVQFVFSYINQDAHSLAISALLAWAWLRWSQRDSIRCLLVAGLATGLLFIAKLNYVVYLPALAAAYAVQWFRRRWSFTGAALRAAALLGCVLVVSGYWYYRNWTLYGQPLGQRMYLSVMAQHQVPGEPQPYGLDALAWLVQRGLFARTFESFFGRFGYMDVAFSPGAYEVLSWVLGAIALVTAWEILRRRDRVLRALGLVLLGFLGALWILFIHYSLKWDVQFQGRYFFPVLVPWAVLLAEGARRRPRLAGVAIVFASAMFLFWIKAQVLLVGRYARAEIHRSPPLDYLEPVASDRIWAEGLLTRTLPVGPRLQQTFLSPRAGLRGIGVLLFTGGPRIHTQYKLEVVRSDTDTVVREAYLHPVEIADHEIHDVVFLPIPDSENRRYRFSLMPVRDTGERRLETGILRAGLYEEGFMRWGGQPTKWDVFFRLIY